MFVNEMKRIRTVILFIVALCSFLATNAQNKTIIRGRVIDKTDNTTIPGANIVEYDSSGRVINGTIASVDGDFLLEMKSASNKVKVSAIGYKSMDIDVNPSKIISVKLESSDVALDEISVIAKAKTTGGLMNIDDRDKTSSSVKVDLLDMKDAGVVSAVDALQGKVTGLDIISASGDPGSGSQLVIRGLSSMGNSSPLIVIDGIPQFRVSSSFDLGSADTEDISNLINVSLQDIKSIEVLKDAASTSIYGSSGASGVLLIETLKGKMGSVKFDYQYKFNLNVQPAAISMLNGDEYITLQLEEWQNNLGLFNVPSEIAYDRDFNDFHNYSANTDWISEITQNALTHDHYFNFSGGGERTRYFTSFGFVDEGGTTTNTKSNRFNTRINLDYFISEKILFQVKFSYVKNKVDGNLKVGGKNIREMAYIKSPNMSIWEYDKEGQPTGEYFTPISSYQGNGVSFFNPVAVANLGRDNKETSQLENTFMLQYRINNLLTFRESVSFQYLGTVQNTFLPYNAIGADWLSNSINSASELNKINQGLRTETQMILNSPFKNKDHQLSGVVSWITNSKKLEAMSVSSYKHPSVNNPDPSIDAQVGNISTGMVEEMNISGVANLNYKFLDRYMLTTNFRADGSSSFGESNRWGSFYGISAGWRFSNEAIFNSFDFLNESMLRFSWGVSGNKPEDVYARFATYESTATGSYRLNPAISATSPQLDNLKWENISSYDLGIELSLFDNRIYFEGGIYKKVTDDILFGGPSNKPKLHYKIPTSSGFEALQYFNGGQMTNTGWELMFDWKIIRTKDWYFSTNFNISRNTNVFNKLPDNFNNERSTSIGNGQYPQVVIEGEPIGSFYGFKYLGVWASDQDVVASDADGNVLRDSEGVPVPFQYTNSYTFEGGDAIYQDINHDGNIDLNDVVYLGNSSPRFIGGFGTTLKYKNFDLSASFNYRIGFDIVNGIAIQTEGMVNRNNQSTAVLRRWQVLGQDEVGMLPRAYMNHPANNLGSDRYVEKGDFLRMSSMKLGYVLNKNMCKKLGIRDARFSLSARKLLTFTGYSGQDPEIGQDASDPFWMGVDEAKTPPPKVYTFSIGVGF